VRDTSVAEKINLNAGQIYIYENKKNYTHLFLYAHGINSSKLKTYSLSRLDANKIFFGVGLPGEYVYTHGGYKIISNRNPIQSTTVYWFNKRVFLPEVTNNHVLLRFPTEVQKKLDNTRHEVLTEENKLTEKILHNSSDKSAPLCFASPLKSKVVSNYGSPRRLPSGKEYFHSGIDLRAPINTSVYSVAEGEVVYVGTMSMPGKNIIIDHGQGLFSRYFHLNNLLVKPKQKVKKGEKIALSGATGRVEAPHLHWEMAWKGIPLNPLDFLQVWAQFCDPK